MARRGRVSGAGRVATGSRRRGCAGGCGRRTHFATRVIRSTVRNATHVLDGILDNKSQLAIRSHSTDTAGYSHIIFALFDLLGLQFAPRRASQASPTNGSGTSEPRTTAPQADCCATASSST